ILRLRPYEKLADNHFLSSIAPGRPDSDRFLHELLEEFLPCFSAPYFHMNADETWDIKEAHDSRSQARIEKLGFARVYLDHVVRVGRMAEKYGKRPILWADMLQKYQDTFARLPKEFIPNFWGYEDKEEFIAAPMAGRHGLAGWISPSVSAHDALFCRLDNAKLNIREAARIAGGNGLEALMNTVWWGGWRAIIGRRAAHGAKLYAEYHACLVKRPSPGSLSLPAGAWHGIAYGGECAWRLPPQSDPSFERRLVHLFYGKDIPALAEAWRLLGTCYKRAGIDRFNTTNQPELYKEMPSKAHMCFESTSKNLAAMRAAAAEAGKLWRRFMPVGGLDPRLGPEFLLASDLTCWTADKALLTLAGGKAKLKWKKLLERHVGLMERYLAGLRARCPAVIARLAEKRLRSFHKDLKKDRG
ncbi:MAG: family 20 glycosylhydrolase, partial [Kiritimatiellota bacterium]|nr:family 20 glycosylhydrolase [Kiritimatiellota bacterium]